VLAAPLLLLVSGLSFLLVSLIPGNAAKTIAGPEATPADVEHVRQQLGLAAPLYEQYWRWLTHALHGDLGVSFYTGQQVSQEISQRLPTTLSLIAGAVLVMLTVGVGTGIFSAVRGGVAGRTVDGLSLIGFALPGFWVGAMLIAIFAVKLGWLPAVGYVPLTQSPTRWLESLALPVIALSLSGIAIIAKQTRQAMLDVLASEHVRMARANGIPEGSILFVYTLKNAAMPILTVLGLQTVALLGGTILVENVFALPGLGSLAVNGAIQQDLPTVQAVTVLFTLIIIGINLIVDVAYTWLNPRVRVT
jgi:peptide/nickel transport system permease protein